VGILFGSLLGAFIGEFAYRREMKLIPRVQLSAKVCLGIVVGSVVGNIVKAILALAAVIIFVVTTWHTVPAWNTSSLHFPIPQGQWPEVDVDWQHWHWPEKFSFPQLQAPSSP
jgi:hypothetical protein